MKTLNQTWKQKRPSKSSVKLTTIRPNNRSRHHQDKLEIDPEQICNDESLNSFGLSCDWENAAISAINEIEAKEQKSCKEKDKKCSKRDILISPLPSNNRLGGRDRISTPIDLAESFPQRFCHKIISPVLAAASSRKRASISTSNQQNECTKQNVEKSSLSNKTRKKQSSSLIGIKDQFESLDKQSLLIDSWGLPETVCEKYKEAGIKEMFPWQKECLMTGKALDGGNLVYSAPTSAGKTLVAELLMLKRVLSTKKKAIYVLPFVSVAREKMFHLQNMFTEAGICVDGYMGAQAPSGGFLSTDIAVCTIEKANSLVNRLMEEKKISSLGVVVVDEMHMIGDGHRGYLLELMLSKIRFLQGLETAGNEESDSNGLQIIGMSATLPNLDMFSSWLNADLYLTDYRPVPLNELMKVGKTIIDCNMQKVAEINSSDVVKGDEEHVIPLCLETIRGGNSVLIFCPTKSWCEKLAKTIADHFKELLEKDERAKDTSASALDELSRNNSRFIDTTALLEVIEQLRRSPAGLDNALGHMVTYAVSFHHAGLTFDERDVIESAFKRGAVRVLVATSTLSSGVNLPARRVILRTPIFHGKVIDSLVYKQMSGRAGRKGVDTMGESILICKPSEKQKGIKLLRCHLEPVYSCLLATKGEDDVPGMKRALLEIIAGGVASTPAHVERYATCTFLNACLKANGNPNPTTAIRNTIKFLTDNEFIRLQSDKTSDEAVMERYYATQLGSATLASALSPDEALVVFRELQKARRCFVLENELHIVYQVMPIYMQSQWPDLDWYHYFTLFEKLPPQYKRVGEIVGVEESFLARAIKGRIQTRTAEQRQKLAVHQRFYSALALLELINEISLRTVSRRYNVNKGLLQSLQTSASTFAGMVTKFCQKLGWRNLEMLLDQFQSRLSFGISRELCDLVRITSLNGARARLFFNAGYHTVSAVAAASLADVTKLLENSAPFESRKNLQGEHMNEIASKNRARCIWVTGKDGLTEEEAAILIINEAKEILRLDAASMGLDIKNIKLISKEKPGKNGSRKNDEEQKVVEKNIEEKVSPRNLQSATKRMVNRLKRRSLEKEESKFEKRSLREQNKTTLQLETMLNSKNEMKSTKDIVKSKKNMERVFEEDKKKSWAPVLERPYPDNNICNVSMNKNNLQELQVAVPSEVVASKRKDHPAEGGMNVNLGRVAEDIGRNKTAGKDILINSGSFAISELETEELQIETKKNNNVIHSEMTKKQQESNEYINEKKATLEEQNVDVDNVSLEEEDGSMILIGSTTSGSFSDDVTPELFTVLVCDDYIPDNNHTQNETLNSSDEVSKMAGKLREKDDNLSTEIEAQSKIEAIFRRKSNETKEANTAINLDNYDNTIDLNLSSYVYDTQDYANGKNHEDEFYLKLSESMQEPLFGSFEGKDGSPLLQSQPLLEERHHSQGEPLPQDESLLQKETTISKSVLNQELDFDVYPQNASELCDEVNNRNDTHHFTKVIKKSKSRSEHNDSSFLLSESDSFDDAMRNFETQEEKKPHQQKAQKAEKRRNSKRIAQMASSAESQEDFTIIDVVVDKSLFRTFVNEWKTKSAYSFSVACDTQVKGNGKYDKETAAGFVVGVAICWGDKDAFYIALDGSNITKANGGLITELDKVNIEETMSAIKEELTKDCQSVTKIVFDLKQHLQVLQKSCDIPLHGKFSDPKVASWLLDPSAKEHTLHELVQRFLPSDYKDIMKKVTGGSFDTGSIGLTSFSTTCPRLRSSVEAVIGYKLMSVLESRLQAEGLYSSFRMTEMPVMLTLGRMELNGIGFSSEKCEKLESILKERMKQIEDKCKSLLGHSFSITSPEEIAHALFIELKLPPTGDPEALPVPKRGTKGSRSKVKHLSTAKGVLEKLKDLHPLPMLILEWRKVHNALLKNVYPMQRSKEYCLDNEMYRIFFNCYFHTVTGRVIIAEPSVQNVPKDFEMLLSPGSGLENADDKKSSLVSLRKAFVPFKNGVFIAADYSQLELRIISHLSKDLRLLSILNNDGDVFRMIAAEINECGVEEVTSDQRQCAKHICYGIIYGIGPKSLGEKLGLSEVEANMFMETFKNRFRGIKQFVKQTVGFVREKGYVLTMNNRRRYFPMINSKNVQARGQAERQAVNTTVQGSAADLVKKAMVDIDEVISREFGESPLTSKHDSKHVRRTRKPRLVLQMHDELIYECCSADRKRLVGIVRTAMEQAIKLEVVLPVKVKTGTNWGDIEDCK